MSESPILVVKIGGSTLGSHDTTLEDLVALQGQAWRLLGGHGGGGPLREGGELHARATPPRREGASVTRRPRTKRVGVSCSFSHSLMAAPPPCTTSSRHACP